MKDCLYGLCHLNNNKKKVSLPSCTSKRKREQEQGRPTGHQGHSGQSRTTLTVTYFHPKSFDISTFFCHHDSCTRVIARKQQRDTFDISFCLLSRFPSLLTTGMATAIVSFTDTQHNDRNSLIILWYSHILSALFQHRFATEIIQMR